MNFSRPNTLIAKFKYIIGLTLAIVSLLTIAATGTRVTTDKVNFEVSPKLTTESTDVVFKFTNKSVYGIDREVYVEKLEKEENGEWIELEFDERINYYTLMAYAYPNACIFPTETVDFSVTCKYLFGQETAPKGNYKVTLSYFVHKGGERAFTTCEFSVD